MIDDDHDRLEADTRERVKPVLGAMSAIGEIEEVLAAGATVQVSPAVTAVPELARNCRIGSVIKCYTDGAEVFGIVRSVSAGDTAGEVHLEVDFAGQIVGEKFARGVTRFPLPGESVYGATDEDLERVYAPGADQALHIGKVFPTDYVEAGLVTEQLLSKHFAILGSTGTGKSSTVALLVHRIVEQMPNSHIFILDPHNEYARAFAYEGIHFNTKDLSLPYWMMNFTEHVELLISHNTDGREQEVDILRRILLAARRKGTPNNQSKLMTVDTPVPYKLTDLLDSLDGEAGKLDKAEDARPFMKIRSKIEELRTDQRYAFMFSGLLVQDSLSEIIAKIFRFPVLGRPVCTLDLSDVPSDIVDVVVALLTRLVFDYASWSRRSGESTPILLICEEAHRYIPSKAASGKAQAARKSLERIAKEGRKYGVSLGLVSQRPSDLSEAVLSQCGTIISMRMNNERDRRYVENAMPEGTRSFLEALPTLQNRECVISGEGVGSPIRVRLDYLEENLRPASSDPEFTSGWKHDIDDGEIVSKIIANWRQGSKQER